MLWFVREVYPYILKQIPDAHLIITGENAGLPLPDAQNITLTGYIDDVKSLVACSWVSVAPLLSGGGTRLKILESMALGTPVVSTSKGAEGLGVSHGDHLLIADEPQAFADCVVKILKNKNLRENIAANAYRFVKEKYDWEIILPSFLQLVESAASQS
ncbi:MAG: glycosyltransferase family 4 protein, partial [Chloroflexota bacterium]